jgi:hypothetical protein
MVDFDGDFSLLGWMNYESSANACGMLPGLTIPDFTFQGPDDPLKASEMPQISSESAKAMHNSIDATMVDAESALENGNSTVPFSIVDASASASPAASHVASTSSSMEEAPDSITIDRNSNTWPYEYQAEGEKGRIAFPALNPEDLRNATLYNRPSGTTSPRKNFELSGSFGKVDDEKRAMIIQLLSLPLIRVPWQEDVDLLRSLPDPDVLHHFTDLYFLHFHEVSRDSQVRYLSFFADARLTALAYNPQTYVQDFQCTHYLTTHNGLRGCLPLLGPDRDQEFGI